MTSSSLGNLSLNFNQLNEQIYELLKNEILNGNFPSGQRLSLNTLAEQLGVSPTPVRDALRQLSLDGLVEISPRRGTIVTEFNVKSVQEIFQIRRIVECAAVENLGQMPKEVTDRMEVLLSRMRGLRDGELFHDYAGYINLDAEFHSCIVGLLQNQQLATFYEKLRWPVQVIRGLSLSRYQRAAKTENEHMAILRAFEERSESQARSAIQQHLNNAEADLIQRMPEPKQ